MGGGGLVRKDQSPERKKILEKPPKEKLESSGRGPKFPHGELRSSYVLNLVFKL